MAASASSDTAYLSDLVRESDRPRYFATLFAPEPLRADLFALFGFAAEIARIPDQVSNPPLGEIRLQWWRDNVERALYAPGQAGDAPAIGLLSETVTRRALPAGPILALIEARRTDLYSDPPATRADLEGLLGETQSALFQLGALIHGASGPDTAEAAGHAGVSYGLARRLALLSADRARGRAIIPADLLAAHGLSPADVFRRDGEETLPTIISELVDWARDHLRKAEAALAAVPSKLRPAFLPLAVVPSLLNRVEGLGARILAQPAGLSDLEALSRIAWRALRDRAGSQRGRAGA